MQRARIVSQECGELQHSRIRPWRNSSLHAYLPASDCTMAIAVNTRVFAVQDETLKTHNAHKVFIPHLLDGNIVHQS